jgi:hypothetical protein
VSSNLLLSPVYCPLAFYSVELIEFFSPFWSLRARAVASAVPKDLLARTAAFLLLKDSKSSYVIEGESPRRIVSSDGAAP